MKLETVGLVCVAVAVVLASCPREPSPPSTNELSPPASIVYGPTRMGKPPLRMTQVKITLVNRHPREMWFLLRSLGETPLGQVARWSTTGSFKVPFGGRGWQTGTARAPEVQLFESHGNGFQAFRLPAKSSLELVDYTIESHVPLTEFEVWEVSALRVNGTTPLQRWLPYETLTSRDARVVCTSDWTNLDWDDVNHASRKDYPDEAVTYVDAEVIGRWTIPREKTGSR